MKKETSTGSLAIVLFTVFLDMLSYGILIPVAPLLFANKNSDHYVLSASYTQQDGYMMLGFLIAAFSLPHFFAAPVLGQISDKYGRRPVLAVSISGTALSYLLFIIGILSKNLPLMFFARVLDGFTGGNISVAQAAVADMTQNKNRAQNFGMVGAAVGMGLIFGPYLGGRLSDSANVSWFNATIPFWTACLLSTINALLVFLFFRETHHTRNHSLKIRWAESFKHIFHAYARKRTRMLFTVVFLFFGAFTFFTTFFGLFLQDRFGYSPSKIGDLFSYIGISIALSQAVLVNFLGGRFTEYQILRFSIIGTGLAALLYFVPDSWLSLILVTPAFAAFNGISQANTTSLVSKSAGEDMQGEILGINASVQALAQAIPPMLSGIIAAYFSPSAPIFASAMIFIFAGVIFILFVRED